MYSVVICNDDRDCTGRSKKPKTESIHSKLPAITASQRVRAKQAKASAEAVQLNATNVYTLSDF